MKYKYIVGLLVALSLNNAFAAEEITAGDYQRIYLAFRCGGSREINAALANNQTFNHKDDTDIIRSSQTGLALRKAVIGLDAADLQAVVETNHEFFKTSLGISLVYGWTLNKFKEPVTPYYIGYYFSFDKLFQGLADKFASNPQVSTFLKSTFTLGLSAVEADRWAFYDHMLYLPYAIEQNETKKALDDTCIDDDSETESETESEGESKAGNNIWRSKHSVDYCVEAYALSINEVIMMTHRTKEEAQTEAKRAPCIAIHLQDNLGDFDHNWKTPNFVGLQKCTIQAPKYCSRINPIALAVFQSLPASTNKDYEFMGKFVSNHYRNFRHTIHDVAHDYFVISEESFMNYEQAIDEYPETTSSETFVYFRGLIEKHKESLKPEYEKDIDFLVSQAENQPLHESRVWAWRNYSKTRREAIAKLLTALRTILKP